jgi:hypothetical protein
MANGSILLSALGILVEQISANGSLFHQLNNKRFLGFRLFTECLVREEPIGCFRDEFALKEADYTEG